MDPESAIAFGPALTEPIVPHDHVRGGGEHAPVTVLEYGDFECPQCALAHPIVQGLQDNFGDQLRFVFRHFPITSAHPHAQAAAEAAEWAAGQGRFWTMYDGLYQRGAKLSEAVILDVAEAVGLSPASLREAWASHSFFPRVKDDFRGGLRTQVAGTPTFFIQGRRYDGRWNGEKLEEVVRALLSANG